MKKTILLAILILGLGFGKAAKAQKVTTATRPAEVSELKTILEKIKECYQAANYHLERNQIKARIQEASVAFKVSKSVTGGGGINIWLVKAEKKWNSERASQVTFNLERRPDIGFAPPSLDELSQLIINAAKEFSELNKEDALPGLKGDSFEIELTFGITRSASGGIEFKVLTAGVEAIAEYEKLAEHTITLKFKLVS